MTYLRHNEALLVYPQFGDFIRSARSKAFHYWYKKPNEDKRREHADRIVKEATGEYLYRLTVHFANFGGPTYEICKKCKRRGKY